MRLLFAGTSKLSAEFLKRVHTVGNKIVGVLVKPPKPAGRGLHVTDPYLKAIATDLGLTVLQPATLRDADFGNVIASLRIDAAIVVDFGMLIPPSALSVPPWGWFNVHFSMLPQWRGASPIHQAILSGTSESGVSIIKLDKELDTGQICEAAKCNVNPRDNYSTLESKLSVIGQDLLLLFLEKLETQKGNMSFCQQLGVASLAPKLNRFDSNLDWNQSSVQLERIVRAFVRSPVAHFWHHLLAAEVKVFAAESISDDEKTTDVKVGTVVSHKGGALRIKAGNGCLRISVVQVACRRKVNVRDLLGARPEIFPIGLCLAERSTATPRSNRLPEIIEVCAPLPGMID